MKDIVGGRKLSGFPTATATTSLAGFSLHWERDVSRPPGRIAAFDMLEAVPVDLALWVCKMPKLASISALAL